MRFFNYAPLLSLLLAAGCSTPVNTEFKPGTSFGSYRTFALLPLPQQASAEDPGLMLRIAQPARETLVRELTAKGLSEAAIEKADLAINLRGQSLPRVEVRDYGYTYPVMTHQGMVTVRQNPYATVSTYNERTLVVEMVDTKAKEVVWVGWTKKNSSGAVKAEDVQKALENILTKFPPAKAG